MRPAVELAVDFGDSPIEVEDQTTGGTSKASPPHAPGGWQSATSPGPTADRSRCCSWITMVRKVDRKERAAGGPRGVFCAAGSQARAVWLDLW